MVTAAKKGSEVAAAATVAMVVTDNNRNCGGRQQSSKCGSGSGKDRGWGSGNCDSTEVCVRQASLRELAQQILAKEKISNSPRGRFSKQQLIHAEGFQRQQLIACTHN